MTDRIDASCIPVLTVMVDYGNAPFLWINREPVTGGIGGNLCDATGWHESYPLTEMLWQQFAGWAIEFDRTHFYAGNCDDSEWDWPTFNARGVELARKLKDEVGDAYRVIYDKPTEDPNHRIDERREVLGDGSLAPIPVPRGHYPEPLRFCSHIISGGQTGADRAALDFAITNCYTHGGWAPRGREAEDGPIPPKYQLTELPDGGYRQRTRRNVQDCDGTLIVNLGEIEGGTLATQKFAERSGKPLLIVPLDAGVTDAAVASVLAWLSEHAITTLNVAGPRESKRPGIYERTYRLLDALDAAVRQAPRPPLESR